MSLADEFIQSPSYELLSRCTKDNLLHIAENYAIELTSEDKKLKESLFKAVERALLGSNVLAARTEGPASPQSAASSVSEMELKMREYSFRERQMQYEAAKWRSERDSRAVREKEIEKELQIRKMEIELEVKRLECEELAITLKWPTSVWSLLLQCVLSGKAQEVYSALTVEQSSDYSTVKTAILNAYELVPEAYRQKFRRLSKTDRITHVEFAREKENLFDRWCTSEHVTSREQLRELVLLEEFKNCVPDAVATYLHDRQVTTLAQLLEPFQSQRMALLCETFL
uniref:SCAN box domain-containing protein n=1 Tax=Denticeps clupeoides TaxID=299321 RepID=A0AAY4C0D5_9TELE